LFVKIIFRLIDVSYAANGSPAESQIDDSLYLLRLKKCQQQQPDLSLDNII